MKSHLESIYSNLLLKMRKHDEQKRFNFLKALEGRYEQKDFSRLDPLCLQHHPYVQKEQLKWVEKMGVGSIQKRFQAEHLELQNALCQRFTPKAFFTSLDMPALTATLNMWLNGESATFLTQTFEKDPLGLVANGFETHLKAPLIQTTFAPFADFYLIEDPLHAFLYNTTPPFLLPPYVLAGIHTSLDLLPSLQKEKKELLEKAIFLFESVKKLGFDLSIQKFALHITTSKKLIYQKELLQKGWILKESSNGLSLYLRQDHEESTLVQFLADLKKIVSCKTAVIC
jgi:hypothetical protein